MRAVLVTGLAVPALYLIAANGFLWFGGLKLLFASTNSVNARYESAWTLWPGVVHLRGARVLFQDANLQWSLDLDEVRIAFKLVELASQTFHATSVEGEGVAFRMRHRIQPEFKDEPSVRALPPIPEYPAPAVFEARVPEPPIPDDQYKLWTIHLEGVNVGVRELWVHFVKFEGKGRAQGKFRLRAARSLWVGPAELKLDSGRMTLDGREIASSVSGAIGCTVHSFDVRVPVGREPLRYISADIRLLLQGLQVEPFNILGMTPPDVRLEGSPGRLELNVSTDHGVLRERSRVLFSVDSLAVRTPELAVVLRDLRTEARGKPSGLGEGSIRAGPIELSRPGLRGSPPRLAEARVVVTSSSRDIAEDWLLVDGRADVSGLAVPDVSVINEFTKSRELRFERGSLIGRGHALYAKSNVTGSLLLELDDFFARSGNVDASLGGKLELSLSDARIRERRGKLKLDAGFSALRVRQTEGKETPLEALADTLHVKAELSRDSKGRAAGVVSASSENARMRLGNTWLTGRPELRLEAERVDPSSDSANVHLSVGVEDLAVDDRASGLTCPWGSVAKLKASADLRLSQSSADGEILVDAEGARSAWGEFFVQGGLGLRAQLDEVGFLAPAGTIRFEARGRDVKLQSGGGPSIGWDAHFSSLKSTGSVRLGSELSGAVRVSAAKVRGRIGKTSAQTDVVASARVLAVDLLQQRAKFVAGVELKQTQVKVGDATVEDWWARIQVDSGLIVAKQNLDLSLPFQAKLRDALPGLRVLGAEGAFPGWIADAVPLRELDVTGVAQRRCRLTDIRFTRTSGGPLSARGRIQSVPEQVRGAFLVRLSALDALSAGVRFGASTDVSLLAGDDWFAERGVELDRAATDALKGPCIEPPRACESGSQ